MVGEWRALWETACRAVEDADDSCGAVCVVGTIADLEASYKDIADKDSASKTVIA